MKSFKLFAAPAILALFLISPLQVLAADLSLSPASGTFNPGCTFSVKMELDTQQAETDGTDALLTYDVSRFNATSITNGTIYPDYPGNVIDAASGKITISGLSSVSSGFKGKGTLATVNFQVAEGAPAGVSSVRFDFNPSDKTLTTDSNVIERGTIADVLNTITDGNFTVGTGQSCSGGADGSSSGGGKSAGNGSKDSGGSIGGKDGGKGGLIATPAAKPLPTQLPDSALTTPTIALAAIGTILTILGIIGLSLL